MARRVKRIAYEIIDFEEIRFLGNVSYNLGGAGHEPALGVKQWSEKPWRVDGSITVPSSLSC